MIKKTPKEILKKRWVSSLELHAQKVSIHFFSTLHLSINLDFWNPATKKEYITQKDNLINLNLKSKEEGKTYSFVNNKLVAND